MSESKIIKISPSTIETIDAAFLRHIDEKFNLFCTTAEGWKKVPVIWNSAERSYQIKNNKEIRDSSGALIPPIISIERISTEKDPDKKGVFWANVSPKNDRYIINKQINQDKTSNFANADALKRKNNGGINFKTKPKNEKIVYQSMSVPIPVYVNITYQISLITSFQQQMNELIEPLLAKQAQNYFIIENESHRYEAFIDKSFEQQSNSELDDKERKYETKIKIVVLGNINSEGNNQDKSNIIIQENAVEVKFPKERLMVGDNVFSPFQLDDETPEKKRIRNRIPSTAQTSNVTETISLAKKTFIIGDGVNSEYSLVHNLDTRDLIVTVRENGSNYDIVYPGIRFTSIATVLIDMGNVIDTNSYSVTIIG